MDEIGVSMAYTGEQLIDEVQALCGRTGDTILITDARINVWLNEAQKRICEDIVGIKTLTFKNAKSLACVSDQMAYAINDITTGSDNTAQKVCHIFGVSFLDGNNSYKLDYIPIDEFDEEYPDPTSSDFATDKPLRWTRRAGNIEVFPLPSTTYADYTLRVDADFYAADFTLNSTEYSDITNADDAIIFYSLAKAWQAIGETAKSTENKAYFAKWINNYKEQNDNLHEWEGSMFG